jgi:hypothetical protein
MNKRNVILLLIAVFNCCFHLAFYRNLEYHRDEMFYYVYGQHLAAGYATTPPLIGLISFFLIKIFGYSLFAVRLVPALLSGVMVIVVAEMVKELNGKFQAQIMGTIAFIIAPFAMRTYFLYMPVFLDVFFWSLTLLFLIRYINRNEPPDLVLLGVSAGIGMLNKYLIALLIALVFVFIVFTKDKYVFGKKHFYYALLAGFIIFLPNLIWQVVNKFPVFNHLNQLNETQLVHVNRSAFLVDQLIMPFPSTFFTIAGLIFLFISPKMKNFRILGWICLSVIIILMILRGKSYYTIGVFPVLIAAGAVSWDLIIRNRILKTAFVLLLIGLSYLILPINLPVYKADKLVRYFKEMEEKSGMTVGRRFEDGTIHSLPQDYADMIGWNELVELTSQAWGKTDDKKAAIIYCENYGQAAAIDVIGKKYHLPSPHCFNDSYFNWLPDSLQTEITNLVYINDELGKDVEEFFADIEKIGQINNSDSREFGTSVYFARNPGRSFNQFWKMRIDQVRRDR